MQRLNPNREFPIEKMTHTRYNLDKMSAKNMNSLSRSLIAALVVILGVGALHGCSKADRRKTPVDTVAFVAASDRFMFIGSPKGEVVQSGFVGEETVSTATALANANWLNLKELPEIVAFSSGGQHQVAISRAGEVWVFGANDSGQLGNGSFDNVSKWAKIKNIPSISRISTRENHSLAVDFNGTMYVAGSNYEGQIGLGTKKQSLNWIPVLGLPKLSQVAAGDYFSFALTEDGKLWATGMNTDGQLGMPASTQYVRDWTEIPGLTGVVKVVAGGYHSLAITKDGQLWVTGRNDAGQLGLGHRNMVDTWTKVPSFNAVVDIAAGVFHSLVVTKDGHIWTSGLNIEGQLGSGNYLDTSNWIQVPNLENVTNIYASNNQSIAILKNDEIWAAGLNQNGQLGSENTYYLIYWGQVIHKAK